MKAALGSLIAGTIIEYEQKILVPVTSNGGKVFCIPIENCVILPINMVVNVADKSVLESEVINAIKM